MNEIKMICNYLNCFSNLKKRVFTLFNSLTVLQISVVDIFQLGQIKEKQLFFDYVPLFNFQCFIFKFEKYVFILRAFPSTTSPASSTMGSRLCLLGSGIFISFFEIFELFNNFICLFNLFKMCWGEK